MAQIAILLRTRLLRIATKGVSWKRLAESADGLSYAEIARAAEEVLKEALLHDRSLATETDIRKMLVERQDFAGKLNKKL